jgi:hypothetical protein
MIREITTYGGYFDAFMKMLTPKEQEKIEYGLMLLETQDKIQATFIEHIKDGLFEFRIEYNGNI